MENKQNDPNGSDEKCERMGILGVILFMACAAAVFFILWAIARKTDPNTENILWIISN